MIALAGTGDRHRPEWPIVLAGTRNTTAVGLTVLAWRNTELENVHAGHVLAGEGRDDDPLDQLSEVADPAERFRIEQLAVRSRTGHGIPDDLMLRLNASTALHIRSILARRLPSGASQRGFELQSEPGGLPCYLRPIIEVLTDPCREMVVGCASLVS